MGTHILIHQWCYSLGANVKQPRSTSAVLGTVYPVYLKRRTNVQVGVPHPIQLVPVDDSLLTRKLAGAYRAGFDMKLYER